MNMSVLTTVLTKRSIGQKCILASIKYKKKRVLKRVECS